MLGAARAKVGASSRRALAVVCRNFRPSVAHRDGPKNGQLFVDCSLADASFPRDSVAVLPEFITEAEESALLAELEPRLAARPIEENHMDQVITGYREIEVGGGRNGWADESVGSVGAAIVARAETAMRELATPGGHWGMRLPEVHVLELEAEGEIDPHVENTTYLGDTLGGISLLSSCVMRLQEGDGHENVGDSIVDLLLPPRSLYVMFGDARYKYTHEIKHTSQVWAGKPVQRDRRISLILRTLDPW